MLHKEYIMKRILLIVAATTLLGTFAQAADKGFYLGGALSQSELQTDTDFFGFDFEDEETTYKLIAGFRPLDTLAIEANYIDFGDMRFDDFASPGGDLSAAYEASAIDIFAVGFIGTPQFELFGKAGLVYWDAEAVLEGNVTLPSFRETDSGTDFAWGGGAQLNAGSLGVRLEFERFQVNDDDEIDLWSLGLTWTFL